MAFRFSPTVSVAFLHLLTDLGGRKGATTGANPNRFRNAITPRRISPAPFSAQDGIPWPLGPTFRATADDSEPWLGMGGNCRVKPWSSPPAGTRWGNLTLRTTVPEHFRFFPASRGASGGLGLRVTHLGYFRVPRAAVVLATRGGAAAGRGKSGLRLLRLGK